jgi:CRISPR-associated protein Cas2
MEQVRPVYVVIIYDVEIERLDSVRHVLKQYLTWIQNSAFEGELTLGKLEEIHILISKIIDKERDSIVVYSVNNSRWLEKATWGREKGTTDNVL